LVSASRGLALSENYTVLKISRRAFDEIKQRMEEAGHDGAFYSDANVGECIDMHGIAIALGLYPKLPERNGH
jgi:hypothetical protein